MRGNEGHRAKTLVSSGFCGDVEADGWEEEGY